MSSESDRQFKVMPLQSTPRELEFAELTSRSVPRNFCIPERLLTGDCNYSSIRLQNFPQNFPPLSNLT